MLSLDYIWCLLDVHYTFTLLDVHFTFKLLLTGVLPSLLDHSCSLDVLSSVPLVLVFFGCFVLFLPQVLCLSPDPCICTHCTKCAVELRLSLY